MKKALYVLLLIFILAIPASAHSGKTDAFGGHIDHSTGEYHYHHGYPAHQHYDIDGDGTDDCPYNFVDNTDHSSGTGGGNVNRSNIEYVTKEVEVLVKDKTAQNIAIALGILCAILIIALICSSKIHKSEINDCEDKIQKLQKHIEQNLITTRKYAVFYAFCCAGFPKDVHITKTGRITFKKDSGKSFRVYTSPNSNIYHCKRGCSSAMMPNRLINVYADRRPCKRCCTDEYLNTVVNPIIPCFQKYFETLKEIEKEIK